MSAAPHLLVGIPVRNEAERITACLQALATQDGAAITRVTLLLNNCTDTTAALVRAFQARSALPIDIHECTLPPHKAHAGHARRRALRIATDHAHPGDVLMTTDADGRVAPDWAANTLAALAAGADVVCGRVELDPAEAALIPAALHADDAQECAYDRLLDEIHALIDPDPFDPLPRHTEASGASIAMPVDIYRRCGGVPPIPLGEDRALIAALRAIDARIRHAPEVKVVVSGRTVGRAVGGMADTIRRRLAAPDPLLDDRLEPAADCARRALLRKQLRNAACDPAMRELLAAEAGLDAAQMDQILALPGFGRRWLAIVAAGLNMQPRRVTVADLPVQMAAAEAIVAGLRGTPISADRGGTPAFVAAATA